MKSVLISIVFVVLSLFSTDSKAQYTDLLFEFQAYPTGLIPGLRLEKSISSKDAFLLRVGYQWIRHRDLGVHDDERGTGYGFTVGYKRYFNETYTKWHWALKTDVWRNTLDWEDLENQAVIASGLTKIWVLQPTIEAGYTMRKGNLMFSPNVAFGLEWNVKTDGAPTGEGPILLIGFTAGMSL